MTTRTGSKKLKTTYFRGKIVWSGFCGLVKFLGIFLDEDKIYGSKLLRNILRRK